MFKKKCPKCNKKIEKSYDFCPHCGKNFKSENDDKDFGFLGKNDFTENNEPLGIGGSFMNKIINKSMKELPTIMKSMEEQMNSEIQNPNNNPNQKPNFPNSNMKIKFMVNGKEVPLNQSKQQTPFQQDKPQKIQSKPVSEEKIQQISKLPRKEPKTIMKRLSGKLVYELSVPGVKDIQDIFINKLENSIEVKAITKNKVYSKTININLPVLRYSLIKELLILEFQSK